MLLANSHSFISFLQFEYLCFFFSCLIAVIRTSNTILSRNGESGHPCLVLKFRGKAFCLFTTEYVSCGFVMLLLLVVSNSVWPHRRQPTRLPHPWDSQGKNTGVGCHFLLQCTKLKRESKVAQSCPTLSDPMDCSLPGSSVHGIVQARVLE